LKAREDKKKVYVVLKKFDDYYSPREKRLCLKDTNSGIGVNKRETICHGG